VTERACFNPKGGAATPKYATADLLFFDTWSSTI
jgi:hypothetical protein